MPKKGKSRTQNKFWNGVISGMRQAFKYYTPEYKEVIDRCRVEIPKYNKDGSLSKKPEVWAKCEKCGELVKSVEVDHTNGFIPILIPSKYMSLDHLIERLRCSPSLMSGLCKKCHKSKSLNERKERKKHEKTTKYIVFKTVNKINGNFYIGMHKSDDYDDGYLGSGTRFKLALKKYGRESFKRYVIFASLSKEEAAAKEMEIISEFLGNSECYNISPGGQTGPVSSRKHNICRTFISCNGETLGIEEWSKKTGIKPNTITYRILRGWTYEEALGFKDRDKPLYNGRLSDEDILYIKNCMDAGVNQTEVGQELGIDCSQISRICKLFGFEKKKS